MPDSPTSRPRRGGAHLVPVDPTPSPLVVQTGATPASFEAIIQMVIDGVDSPHTKVAYRRALVDFLDWHTEVGRPPLTKATVQAYRTHLKEARKAGAPDQPRYSPATINQRLAAIRKLAREAADNGLLNPADLAGVERVSGVKLQGTRSGNWLDLAQAQTLLDAPDPMALKGLRDRALLAVLVGCGLRRSEVVALTFDDVQQREGRWVIVDLVGKHQRVRSVPMPGWCKEAIEEWVAAAGFAREGCIFRPLNRHEQVIGSHLAVQTVLDVVRHYGRFVGQPGLAPHDLRRTFARLARKGGSDLDQIKESLGHASVQTTERYVGAMQSLADAPADRLGLALHRGLARGAGQRSAPRPSSVSE